MKSSLKPGAVIQSSSCRYQLQRLLGSGVYGKVLLCRNLTSNQTVALKVLSGPYAQKDGRDEEKILQTITAQGSEDNHIVRWFSSFESSGCFFHEFEMLDISLTQFLNKRPNGRLQVWETRPIIRQMAEALEFLQSVGIMHCDLKPENILMINHVKQPMRIKIIDFGLACSVNEAMQGVQLQTLQYRAPETLLGASVHVAIDMWSVGCIAAEMVLGHILLPARNELEIINFIVETVGHPPKSCLDQGMFTSKVYRWSKHKQMWKYKLKDLDPACRRVKRLDDICAMTTTNASADYDRAVFVHLVKRMMDPNPETRISPEKVVQHPFIRMSHLEGGEPAYFAQSVRLLSETWEAGVVNSTLAAQPAEAPPRDKQQTKGKQRSRNLQVEREGWMKTSVHTAHKSSGSLEPSASAGILASPQSSVRTIWLTSVVSSMIKLKSRLVSSASSVLHSSSASKGAR